MQDNGLVPIVEPEILLDGEHGIDTTFEVYTKGVGRGVLLLGRKQCDVCRHTVEAKHGYSRSRMQTEGDTQTSCKIYSPTPPQADSACCSRNHGKHLFLLE